MAHNCFALLGRRDEPTDAVEEYCRYLSEALAAEGWKLQLERVPWIEEGWPAVLVQVAADRSKWSGSWALLHYTALAWSRRGLAWRLVRLVRGMQHAGARCAIIFHDAEPYSGRGFVPLAKRRGQIFIMRRLCEMAELSILTVPLEQVFWLPKRGRFLFVPVGANLPEPERAWVRKPAFQYGCVPTLAMFSPTGGASGLAEARLVAGALRPATATLGPIRLVVLGRNSEEAGSKIRELLSAEEKVSVEVLGLCAADEIVAQLSRADALLFVRGALSTRRSSGIAGIACGLPIIALEGGETAGPVREAGVLFVSKPDPAEFSAAIARLFSEPGLRDALAERSRQAQRNHFSWPAIAARIATELRKLGE